jgi:anti-sigma factor ChrR (cupin superfamily)
MLLAVLAGCSRPGPSPDYLAAREKHAALAARHDAAASPAMDEVLALLDRVPEGSADAAAARELRERIVAERAAVADHASQRAALLERAGEAPAWPEASSIGRPLPRPSLAVGITEEEFRAVHGGCFERQGGEFRLAGADGKEQPVESWVVTADAECRERYADQLDQLVLIAGGSVVAVRPASAATKITEERVVERQAERAVELVPMAGGVWGMRTADGKVEPIPAGAQVRSLDGQPLPPVPAEARP